MTQALQLPFAVAIDGRPATLSKVGETPLPKTYADAGWRMYHASQGPRCTLLGWTIHGRLVWLQAHNIDPNGPSIVLQTPDETVVIDRWSGWCWADKGWAAEHRTQGTCPSDYNCMFSDGADNEDPHITAETGSPGIDFANWPFCFAVRDGWTVPTLLYLVEWLAIQAKRPGSGAIQPNGNPLSWLGGSLPLLWGTHEQNAAGYARADEHHHDLEEAFIAATSLRWPMGYWHVVTRTAFAAAAFPSWRTPVPATSTYYGNPRVAAYCIRNLRKALFLMRNTDSADPALPVVEELLARHVDQVDLLLAKPTAWLAPWWTGGGHPEMHDAQLDYVMTWQRAMLSYCLQEMHALDLVELGKPTSNALALADGICTWLVENAWDPKTGTVWGDISGDLTLKVPASSVQSWFLPALRAWQPKHPLVHQLIAATDPDGYNPGDYAWRFVARLLGTDVELGKEALLAASA